MPVPETNDEGFDFNDLSQHPPVEHDRRHSSNEAPAQDGQSAPPPKAKRIACILCRKRKLKCDGQRPSCGTCKRLAHDCAYDEVRKKSGPKRGYVKALEARLRMLAAVALCQIDLELNNVRRQNKSRRSSRLRNPTRRPRLRDQIQIQMLSLTLPLPNNHPLISRTRTSFWTIYPRPWTMCSSRAMAYPQVNSPLCRVPPPTTALALIPSLGK